MKRLSLGLITILILASVGVASAAALQVDGGVLQVFVLMGDALNLPDFTKGLHRLSTHYRFNQQGATCDAEAGTLWVDILNNGDEAGEQANLELWYFGEASGLGSEPELIQVNEITLPDPKTEQRYEMAGVQISGHYRFHLDFGDSPDGDAASGNGPGVNNGQGPGWSGVIPFDSESCSGSEVAPALRISGPTTIAIESLSASGAANDDGSLTASGQLCVANTGTAPTEGLWIFVSVGEAGEAQTPASYAAEPLPAPPPAEKIEEGAEQPWRHCYEYSVTFSPVEGVDAYTAAATVLISNHADYEEPGSYGPSAEAGFTVAGLPEAEETPTGTPSATPTLTPGAQEIAPTDKPTATLAPEAGPDAAPPVAPTAEPTPVPTPTEDKGEINHETPDDEAAPTDPPPTEPPADEGSASITETPPPATEEPAG